MLCTQFSAASGSRQYYAHAALMKVKGTLFRVAAIAIPLSAAWAYYYYSDNSMALAAVRARNAAASFPGRHAVVVGGTSGIGEGIALRLAEANFSVTVVGRNAERGAAVVEQMRARGRGAPGAVYSFVPADAQYLASAKAFSTEYSKSHTSLDVLVLTQGIATFQGRTETSEGVDQKLALHYYGRMAFIAALLPLLRAAPAARVLTVLTAGVHPPYAGYATDPELKTSYSTKLAADAACMYNDLAVDALSREPGNERITFVHAAPGFVSTNWGTEMPWYVRMLVRAIQPLGRSSADCAEFMCEPLLRPDPAPGAASGGFLLMGANAQPVGRTARHEEARDVVWKHTKEMLAKYV
jgi:NAD(P)-dependent dehydrogenase (short-subunit alcohol dehydrogenase family)